LEQFYLDNPDYPRWSDTIIIDAVHLEVQEGPELMLEKAEHEYNLDELFYKPISQQILDKVKNDKLRELAETCNDRNAENGYKPYLVNGKTCLWSLRVGPVLQAPSALEMMRILRSNTLFYHILKSRSVRPGTIRGYTDMMMTNEIASYLEVGRKEVGRAIWNDLECTTHEDDCGFFYLVPRWAATLFKQKGYTHKTATAINRMKKF
jgi:hypothetical protein